MNKMKEVARLMGVELGGKFKIATNDGRLTGGCFKTKEEITKSMRSIYGLSQMQRRYC